MPETTTTPAEVLRAAAAKLRAAAGACEPSVPSLRGVPWHTEVCAVDLGARAVAQDAPAPDERARFVRYIADAETPELAAWIALMGPPVGLALAGWLESTAAEAERFGADPFNCQTEVTDGHPMAVALAVLRRRA